MSRKTINPTIDSQRYIALWYRYMRLICSIKKISMLNAIEQFGLRYRILYSEKIRFKEGRLSRS